MRRCDKSIKSYLPSPRLLNKFYDFGTNTISKRRLIACSSKDLALAMRGRASPAPATDMRGANAGDWFTTAL